MALVKSCPYCTRPLSVTSIVMQRLRARDKASLKCDKCGSTVSAQGGARLELAGLLGVGSGLALGEAFADLLANSLLLGLLAAMVGVLVFVLVVYYGAPIRNA